MAKKTGPLPQPVNVSDFLFPGGALNEAQGMVFYAFGNCQNEHLLKDDNHAMMHLKISRRCEHGKEYTLRRGLGAQLPLRRHDNRF
jgi:hypothetical protein